MLELIKPPGAVDGTNIASTPLVNDSKNTSITNKEENEYNLNQALNLRCINQTGFTECGHCDSCLLLNKIREFRQCFFRFGDHSKKRFMLGLLKRMRSIDLLKNTVLLLQPTLSKDCIYSRARTNPSLDTDSASVSSDRAMSAQKVEETTMSNWDWFSCASYYMKANFALCMFQMCDIHLLHTVFTQAKTLLASEMKAAEALQG